jgi:hypothetical protein
MRLLVAVSTMPETKPADSFAASIWQSIRNHFALLTKALRN